MYIRLDHTGCLGGLSLTLGANAQRGFCTGVCVFVGGYSGTAGYEAAYERYQRLQSYEGLTLI